MKPTTRLILILILATSFTTSAQTKLSKDAVTEYCYYAYHNYRYGKGAFKVIIDHGMVQNGYLDVIQIAVGMENLINNVQFREKTLEVLYRQIGPNQSYIFANLTSLGISATSSQELCNYMLGKYGGGIKKTNLADDKLQAKKQFDGIVADYKSGDLIYSLGANPIAKVEHSLLLSDADKELTLDVEQFKITCAKDSLIEFLSNYFENESVFIVVSKEGYLVRLENEDESKVIDVKKYPELVQWVKLKGKFYLNHKTNTFPVNIKYPLLEIQKQKRKVGDYYYFSIEGENIDYVTDTVNVSNSFYKFLSIKESKNNRPVFLFDKQKVQSQVFTIAGVKKTKDLRKVANLGKSAGASLGLGMLKVVSGIPFGSTDSRSVNDNFFRFVEVREVEEVESKSLSKVVDLNHKNSKELSKVYGLEVYNQHQRNFLKLK